MSATNPIGSTTGRAIHTAHHDDQEGIMLHGSDHQDNGPMADADRWQVAYCADTPLTHAGLAAGFLPFVEHVSPSYATQEEARRVADGLIGTARDGGAVLWAWAVPGPAPRTGNDADALEDGASSENGARSRPVMDST